MCNAVGDDFDRETLGAANCLVARPAVTHHAWKFGGFRDPAPIGLAIQLDRQVHGTHHTAAKGLPANSPENGATIRPVTDSSSLTS